MHCETVTNCTGFLVRPRALSGQRKTVLAQRLTASGRTPSRGQLGQRGCPRSTAGLSRLSRCWLAGLRAGEVAGGGAQLGLAARVIQVAPRAPRGHGHGSACERQSQASTRGGRVAQRRGRRRHCHRDVRAAMSLLPVAGPFSPRSPKPCCGSPPPPVEAGWAREALSVHVHAGPHTLLER